MRPTYAVQVQATHATVTVRAAHLRRQRPRLEHHRAGRADPRAPVLLRRRRLAEPLLRRARRAPQLPRALALLAARRQVLVRAARAPLRPRRALLRLRDARVQRLPRRRAGCGGGQGWGARRGAGELAWGGGDGPAVLQIVVLLSSATRPLAEGFGCVPH